MIVRTGLYISNNIKSIGLLLGPISFIVILLFFHPEGLGDQARAVFASTVWIAIWWITECIPIAVTSLLPIVLFPLSGALDISTTTSSFGHKYIFLYVGGFMLAIAIERWDLHRRIALNIIKLIGTDIRGIILGFMIGTAFLSMWISNTATSVMMLPIGMAIVSQFQNSPLSSEKEVKTFGKALMLSIAYSASIGGTPPNLLLAGIIDDIYGIEISFFTWLSFGLPISVTLLFISWTYLTRWAFKFTKTSFPGGRAEITHQVSQLGRITPEEKSVLMVFTLTGLAWISRPYLQEWAIAYDPGASPGVLAIGIGKVSEVISRLDDTVIAVIAGLSLFVIPASGRQGRSLITWSEAVKLPWGILFLFGGGLALAEGFKVSGLAQWFGSQLSLLDGVAIIVLLLVVIAGINFLTEITSNLATTAMMLPTLATLALAINVHPYLLMVGATVAASCAFMLPVATPPNAVVFGSGYLKIKDMVRVGLLLNLISILLLTVVTYWLLPILWEFIPNIFPQEMITR